VNDFVRFAKKRGDTVADASVAVTSGQAATFDIDAIARAFPKTASTMLIDTRLTDEPEASARVFRVYRPTPQHYHATCDEYLLVVSGRARFVVAGGEPFELGPGQLLFFKRGTVHGTPEILEEPFVMLSVDTPRREPKDIIFVNPEDGTPEGFIQTESLS
jgi:mannose-6-phosphate isomerase-like protein (cupin superfamily)